MSVSQRAVEALVARISDGAFRPGAGFEYPPKADHPALVAKRRAFRVEANRLEHTEFKAEALVAVGLADHPKADKAWRMAWGQGHSEGLESVLEYLIDLADLLQ